MNIGDYLKMRYERNCYNLSVDGFFLFFCFLSVEVLYVVLVQNIKFVFFDTCVQKYHMK